FLVTAPSVFHVGVEEQVLVQVGETLLNKQVTCYLEQEVKKVRMSGTGTTTITAIGQIGKLSLKLEHPHTAPADGAVGVEVEGHQAFWTCDNDPSILVLTTVPPHTDSLGVSTKTKAGLIPADEAVHLTSVNGEPPYLNLVCDVGDIRRQIARVLVSQHSGYIFIQTDQPIYNPTQTVKYRIFTLDHSMRPKTDIIFVHLINSEGNTVKKVRYIVKDGVFSKNFHIPDVSQPGVWKIKAHYKGDEKSASVREFKVQKFVLPSFGVSIKADPDYLLLTAESLKISVSAVYSYGKRITGGYHCRFGYRTGSDKITFIKGLEKTGPIRNGEVDVVLHKSDIQQKLQPTSLEKLAEDGVRFYIAVTVTDTISGEIQETETTLPIVSQRYLVDLSRTRSYYIPQMPLDVVVVVRTPNGLLAEDVPVRINVANTVEKSKDANTQDDGIATNSFNLERSPESLSVEVTVDGVKFTKTVLRATSSSNNFLHITVTSKVLSAGNTLSVSFKPVNGKPVDKRMYYMVVSKGVLIESGSREGGDLIKTDIPITAAMTPSFRLIGYYYHSNGEIIADSVWVDVKDTCEGKIEVTKKDPQNHYQPGHLVKLDIDVGSQKKAKVALLAVDKAIYALNAQNKLTPKQVFSSMQSYDLGCSYGGGVNSAAVFNDAGLAFISHSKEMKSQMRKGFSCESGFRRQRRAIDLQEEMRKKESEFQDAALQKCCHHGLTLIPMQLSCEQRMKRIRTTEGKACLEAFLQCCTFAVKLRDKKRREDMRSGHGRTASAAAIEEFFNNEVQNIRQSFPASFEFKEITVDGKTEHDLHVPDSITTWEIQALSLSSSHGFCVASPLHVTVFKELFVALRLPYSVKRNEQLAIVAVIYNYGQTEREISVQMVPADGLCSPGSQSSSSYINITVAAESSETVTFSAVPLKQGEIPILISLYDRKQEWGVDAIQKTLLVMTEGVSVREEKSYLINLDGRTDKLMYIDAEFPNMTVPDSTTNVFVKVEAPCSFLWSRGGVRSGICEAPSVTIQCGESDPGTCWLRGANHDSDVSNSTVPPLPGLQQPLVRALRWNKRHSIGFRGARSAQEECVELHGMGFHGEQLHPSLTAPSAVQSVERSGVKLRPWTLEQWRRVIRIDQSRFSVRPRDSGPSHAPSIVGQFGDGPFLFQHDRTPVHRASSIKTWMSESGVEELDWPAQSPDLHLIEHLWDGLEWRLRARPSRPTSGSDLTHVLLEEWSEIPINTFLTLVERLPRRDVAVMGYDRILTQFKKTDGSYGAWRDYPSSYWLTALVVKVLSLVADCELRRSAGQVLVSEKEIRDPVNYLIQKQNGDGSFTDPHPVIHREMQGGIGGLEQDVSLTAFITIALNRSLPFMDRESDAVKQSISRATSFLLSRVDDLKRPYAVAITAYCLSTCLPERALTLPAWKKLKSLAKQEGECMVWRANEDKRLDGERRTTLVPPAVALTVETTAYSLLAALAHEDMEVATAAACFLSSQENYEGGFKSTQDTIVALEALSEYAIHKPESPFRIINIQFTRAGRSEALKLDSKGEKVETELKRLQGGKITAKLSGKGEVKIKVVKAYYDLNPFNNCENLSINITVKGKVEYTAHVTESYDYYDYGNDEPSEQKEEEDFPRSAIEWFDVRSRRRRDTQQRSEDTLMYEVCVSHSLSQNLSGMAIADITLLSGFEANTDDLDKLKDLADKYISHYEVSQGRVLLYFNEIVDGEVCVSFEAMQKVPIGLVQPAPATFYDYYEPDRRCSVFYAAPRRSKLVSVLCSEDVCQCAERGCYKERKTFESEIKKEQRLNHACYQPVMDYGFVVTVEEVNEVNSFQMYVTKVNEVLKYTGQSRVEEGDIKVFAKRKHCKGQLDIGQTYLIMGTGGPSTAIKGPTQYLLDGNTWVEQKPSPGQCRASNKGLFCKGFKDFLREYQINGCSQ
ncbi:hypothetical protein NFI96_027254, partial [Prochilodus magdalenae]